MSVFIRIWRITVGNIMRLLVIKSAAKSKPASFEGWFLVGANLKRLTLSGVSFKRANLSHANLTKASFVQATLQGANFHRTNLRDASFLGAQGVFTKESIGSRGATLTAYRCDNDIFFTTGCFLGDLNTFLERIKLVHRGTEYERPYYKAVGEAQEYFANN